MKSSNFKNLATALLVGSGVATVQIANATLTWSSPLTLNSPGVVGTVDGLAGDNPGSDAIYFAQELLDLSANTVNFHYTDISSGMEHVYNTSSTEYSGTLFGGVQVDNNYQVPIGYDYAIAKYDGQNAGWVLFYLGGQAADLPQFSYSIWGSNSGQYGISGFTAFHAGSVIPEPSSLIAGALLLLPFGASALRILRRNRTA